MRKYIAIITIIGLLPIYTFAQTVLFPNRGGTGASSIPTYGQVLVGNSSGTLTLTATSSLGIVGSGTGSVTSVSTNNGLTGGPITTTGTIGIDTTGLSARSLVSWNGSSLSATGTPSLTVGYLNATTSTATSTFAGNIKANNARFDNNLYAIGNIYGANGNKVTIGEGSGHAGLTVTMNTSNQIFFSDLSNSVQQSFLSSASANSGGYFSYNGLGANEFTLKNTENGQLIFGANDTSFVYLTPTLLMGIGTTTPYAKLSVDGSIAGWYFNADDKTSTSTLRGGLLVGSSTPRFLVNNYNGFVGIGTSTPYALLSITGIPAQTVPVFSISTSTASYSTSTVFFVDSNGKTTIKDLQGSGNAYACVDSNGKLFRSSVACI